VRRQTLFDLVGRVYDAAGDQKLWASVVEDLEAECGDTVALFFPFPRSGDPGFAVAPSVDPFFLESYRRRYFAIDPVARLLPELTVGSVDVLYEDGGAAPLESASFHREWIAPQGLLPGPSLVGVIERDSGGAASVLRTFPRRAGRGVARAQRCTLQSLMPHLRRGLQVSRRVQRLELERQSLATAIDRLQVGLLLVSASGHVVAKNRAADRILAKRDGLLLESDGLHGSCSETTSRLRRALLDAARGETNDPASVSILSLPRPSGRRPLAALAAGCKPGGEACAKPSLVALYVSDLDEGMEVPGELLRRFFGLTHSEAALARQISSGRSLEEAAEHLRVSVGTTRTRLRQVFLKTNTHRQAELVRLLLSTPA